MLIEIGDNLSNTVIWSSAFIALAISSLGAWFGIFKDEDNG